MFRISERVQSKIYLSFIVVSLSFFSCRKEKQEPIDAPQPLRELISKSPQKCSTCGTILMKYLWRGKTVYTWGCFGMACDCRPPYYYDESGQKFDMDAGYTYIHFGQESQLIKIVWRCECNC